MSGKDEWKRGVKGDLHNRKTFVGMKWIGRNEMELNRCEWSLGSLSSGDGVGWRVDEGGGNEDSHRI